MAEPQPECTICFDECNRTKKKPIDCPYCGSIFCKECVEQNLVSNNVNLTCMNPSCRKDWSLLTITKTLGKTFLTKKSVVDKRKQFFLNQEKAQAEVFIERIEAEKERQRNIDKLMARRNILSNKVYQIDSEINELCKNQKPVSVKKRDVLCHCPVKDCRGIVKRVEVPKKDENDTVNHRDVWECVICNKRICPRCWKPLLLSKIKKEGEKGHICNKEDVESVTFIKNSTKPCPNCKIPIHKISGCPAMFCSHCKASWDWDKEILISSRQNTNPHLAEYMIRNPNAKIVEDPNNSIYDGCGRYMFDRHHLNDILKKIRIITHIPAFAEDINISLHSIWETLRDIYNSATRNFSFDLSTRKEKLGLSYYKGHIEEDEYSSRLLTCEKTAEIYQEVINIVSTFSLVADSYLYQFYIDVVQDIDKKWTTPELFEHYLDLIENILDLKDNLNFSLQDTFSLTSAVKPFVLFNKIGMKFYWKKAKRLELVIPNVDNPMTLSVYHLPSSIFYYDLKTNESSRFAFYIRVKTSFFPPILEDKDKIIKIEQTLRSPGKQTTIVSAQKPTSSKKDPDSLIFRIDGFHGTFVKKIVLDIINNSDCMSLVKEIL